MTVDTPQSELRRAEWLRRLGTLVDQVANWAIAEGWTVARGRQAVRERLLGEYEVPTLDVRMPGGELSVRPVALDLPGGGNGRVDLEAYPTLNRVKLVGRDGTWVVLTDSNVPLREPWDAEAFVRLAGDLMA